MFQRVFFGVKIFQVASAGLAALLVFAAIAWAEGRDDCTQTADRVLRIKACTEIIDSEKLSDAKRAVAYFNRGSAHDGIGEVEKAIADYSAALKFNPEMSDAYFNRANAYFAIDDLARAIEDYGQVVLLDPTAVHALNNRGEAYSRLGDGQRAIEDFNQAMRIDPQYIDAYRNRGVVHESMGSYREAVADWDREIELGGAERVKWWQQYLSDNGHYAGEIDGVNSPTVWAALTACAADPDC